ncbi:LysR substrate-binding domain-containing protein [Pseudomonas sp. B392_1p]|uniref:LysR substrate-binding domain-containing protein n=1 Tax=Pseudomonas sp. B392_1p TaxID=3457507 RepID=UPI003FCFA9C5
MDDISGLIPFVQAVKSGSFTAAAKQLGISTTAVSKSIARLERRLDTRLFNRTTRRLHLTAEGQLFYEHVDAGLAQIRQASALLRDAREGPAGTLRVSTVTYFGRYFLMPLVPDFLEAYPKIDLEISINDEMPDLVEEGFDIGIVHGTPRETRYVSRHLYRLPLVLVASPEYLARKGEPHTPQELKEHDCVVAVGPAGRAVWSFQPASRPGSETAEHYLYNPTGRVVVSKLLDTVVDAALMGLGVTIAFVESVLPHLQSGRLRVLLPDYLIEDQGDANVEIHLQYPNREYVSLKVRALVDFLVERFRAYEKLDYRPATLRALYGETVD